MKRIYLLLLPLLYACQPTAERLPEVQAPHRTWQVGLLIMEGVYNTELTAPMDIFHHTQFHHPQGMRVFTVAKTREPVRSFEGLIIQPDFGYLEEEVPAIDVLVVPSAEHHLDSDLRDTVMLDFVRETASRARYVMSLCDGAFVLAQAGLLNDAASTTFPGDIAQYRQMFPHLTVHEDVIFVHDGKYITGAGGARSFEPALYLSELLYGKKVADGIAKGMVIDWNVGGVEKVVVQ